MDQILLATIRADVQLALLTVRNGLDRLRAADPRSTFSIGVATTVLATLEGTMTYSIRLLDILDEESTPPAALPGPVNRPGSTAN